MARRNPISVRLGQGLLVTLLVTPFAPRMAQGGAARLALRIGRSSHSFVIRRQPSAVQITSERPHIHTIVPGDTLWAIARSEGITVAALAAANRLSSCAILRLGETLRVPPRRAGFIVSRIAPCPVSTDVIWRMRWPTRGIITSPFGWRWLFQLKEFHPGIDIGAAFGTPVRAAQAGTVRAAGWVGGWGRKVIIVHDPGLDTLYAHLSRTLVWSGERVQQGTVIGTVGSTGLSTGPHLHFGVLRNGHAVNPVRYLQ